MADIDASETATWYPDGAGGFLGWSPIGHSSANFTGLYNGNHYTIHGLYINRPTTQDIGLFGIVRNATTTDWRMMIRRLGLIDVNITGGNNTGALVGNVLGWYAGSYYSPSAMYRGLIEECYSIGTVSGGNDTGGLAGLVNSMFFNQCYTSCTVTGNTRVGGFAGNIEYHSNTYNSFSVSSVAGADYVGGFAARMTQYSGLFYCYSSGYVAPGGNLGGLVAVVAGIGANATQSYWDTVTSGRNSSALGDGRTTSQLKSSSTYGSNWDFTPAGAWWMVEGKTRPILRSARKTRIFTALHLQLMGINPAAQYQVMQDLNLSCLQVPADVWGTNPGGNGGFVPVGTVVEPFTGTLNGNGFQLSNLYIRQSTGDNVGLIGRAENATLSDLTLSDVNITGNWMVGALVGEGPFNNTMTNCHSSGSVTGAEEVGGLAGYFRQTISACSSTASVTGTENMAGGLVGYLGEAAVVENCMAAGNVAGNLRAGGLVGLNFQGNIDQSFSLGNVSGSNYVGGLAGVSSEGSAIGNCYFRGEVSRSSSSSFTLIAAFAGNNSGSISHCYAAANVFFTEGIDPVNNGFAGGSGASAEYSANFFDSEAFNQSSGLGATPKTTLEMQTPSTFTDAGWDFTTIWAIDPDINAGYAYLLWEDEPAPPEPPLNLSINYSGTDVIITWDAVTGASSYKVYSCATSGGEFSEDSSGVLSGTSWSAPATEPRRFYQVTAIAE